MYFSSLIIHPIADVSADCLIPGAFALLAQLRLYEVDKGSAWIERRRLIADAQRFSKFSMEAVREQTRWVASVFTFPISYTYICEARQFW